MLKAIKKVLGINRYKDNINGRPCPSYSGQPSKPNQQKTGRPPKPKPPDIVLLREDKDPALPPPPVQNRIECKRSAEKMQIRNIEHTTSFVVMPEQCNIFKDMLCGGDLMKHMDLAAAVTVIRALYDSPTAKAALTVGVTDIEFLVGAVVGDIVFLKCTVVKAGIKSITVQVEGERERHLDGVKEDICRGTFTFCAIDKETRKSIEHKMELA